MPTPLSRRSMIAASAAAMAAPLVRSQAQGMPLSVRSRSGLRLEQHGDPQRPTVALYLPKRAVPSMVIEMPEHAWYRETPSGQQTWFYKMYTTDSALKGRVEWAADSRSLSFVMKTPSGFTLNTTATLDENGVAITHKVASGSVTQMVAVEAPTCVKLYRPFIDIFLERTYIHLPDGPALIAADTPNRLAMNAEEWLPCRYIARVGKNAPHENYRTEVLDGVTRHFKSDAA